VPSSSCKAFHGLPRLLFRSCGGDDQPRDSDASDWEAITDSESGDDYAPADDNSASNEGEVCGPKTAAFYDDDGGFKSLSSACFKWSSSSSERRHPPQASQTGSMMQAAALPVEAEQVLAKATKNKKKLPAKLFGDGTPARSPDTVSVGDTLVSLGSAVGEGVSRLLVRGSHVWIVVFVCYYAGLSVQSHLRLQALRHSFMGVPAMQLQPARPTQRSTLSPRVLRQCI
jgi:hypothetical protein